MSSQFPDHQNNMQPFKMPDNIDNLSNTQRLHLIQNILDLFFNNEIKAAEACIEPHKEKCQHFSHAKIQFVSISSLLTLDPELMESAKSEIKRHLDMVHVLRPKRPYFRLFGSEDYNSYTDDQMIAELNHCEALIAYALFTFLNGQSIMSLIRAALKINSAYSALTFCHEVLKHKNNWSEEQCLITFSAGVLNGLGISNLVLSNLPSSILKLLSLAGMSSDRDLGVSYLKQVSSMKNQPRIQFNYCMILGYCIYLEQMLGFAEGTNAGDYLCVDEVANSFLSMYPNGAVPLFLNGRVALLHSQPHRAIQLYRQCLDIKNEWVQIDLFCYFDLVWSYAVIMDWENALKYCKILMQNCTWGHAINAHLYACLLCMQNRDQHDPEIDTEIRNTMQQVEGMRKRYAGRSYPAEKFAVERAKQYLASKPIPLPVFELFHVWNVFSMMRNDKTLLDSISNMIEKELSQESSHGLEQTCVLKLLRGICAKYSKDYETAIEYLKDVISHECDKSLVKSYVIPHAMMELGLVFKEQADYKSSRMWIEKAKSGHKEKYLLEALIQLKAHSVLRQIDELEIGTAPRKSSKSSLRRFSFFSS